MECIVFDANDTRKHRGDGTPDVGIIAIDVDAEKVDLAGNVGAQDQVVDVLPRYECLQDNKASIRQFRRHPCSNSADIGPVPVNPESTPPLYQELPGIIFRAMTGTELDECPCSSAYQLKNPLYDSVFIILRILPVSVRLETIHVFADCAERSTNIYAPDSGSGRLEKWYPARQSTNQSEQLVLQSLEPWRIDKRLRNMLFLRATIIEATVLEAQINCLEVIASSLRVEADGFAYYVRIGDGLFDMRRHVRKAAQPCDRYQPAEVIDVHLHTRLVPSLSLDNI